MSKMNIPIEAVVLGKHFKTKLGFSMSRWEDFIEANLKPVVFLSNLHKTPTVEYGFIARETERYCFVMFMENILHFCDNEFDGTAMSCVTAKACRKEQCFVLDSWTDLSQLEKPFLIDRRPVYMWELTKLAEKLGYAEDEEGIPVWHSSITILRNAGHIVEPNNYLNFKHKL
jgi:hypothetical protein